MSIIRTPLLLAGLLTAAVSAFAQAPAAAGPPKPDLAKGQSIATQVCAACHAVDGSRGAPANPIIAGQHPEYLIKQLAEFKAGIRKNPIMQGIAAQLSEADMKNVAAFYASKDAKPGFARDKTSVELGASIWRGGLPDRQIAACASCHSPTGAGVPSQYPRLAGQHGDYTLAQMIAFRNGTRANSPQMTMIAAKMTDPEIRAVSDFVAGLR